MRTLAVFTVGLLLCTHSPAASLQQETAPSKGRISLKSKTWGVVLDLPGFSLKINETKPDGRRYMMANNSSTGVVVSLTLEEALAGGSTQGCKESLETRAKDPAFAKKEVKLSESGAMTFLEYLIPEIKGIPVRQKNLFVCQFRDNVFIDIHFSKASYQAGDEKLFQVVLDTVQVQEGIQRSSLDYMQVASAFYLQRNYARAIPPYVQALALEKQNPQLDKTMWRVLVDNLGMSYGITGDLKSAKETFEYGIGEDPTYPLFHYNMACTYAEMNDMENAMSYLKKAFEYKGNVIAGEKMPDPRTDDSFKRFLKNKDFRKLVDSLVTSAK